MQGYKSYEEKLFYTFRLSERVPVNNFYRRLKDVLDLSFIRKYTQEYYGKEGQTSIDPVVFFKLMLIGYLENIPSDRKIVEQAGMRLDMLYFFNYNIDEPLPWHSTLSRTRKLYGEELFLKVFNHILELCIKTGMVDGRTQAIDSTLIKANASMASLRVNLKIAGREYYNKLKNNSEDSEEDNTKYPPKSKDPRRQENEKRVSLTDPDSKMATKSGRPLSLCYQAQISVDTASHIICGALGLYANIRDSQCLPFILNQAAANLSQHDIRVENVLADTNYSGGPTLKYLEEAGIKSYIPCIGNYKNEHKDFSYDSQSDCFICRMNKKLTFRKIHKSNVKTYESIIYRSSQKDCSVCPLKGQCIKNKTYPVKELSTTIYKPYYENAYKRVHSPIGRKMKKLRSSTVEPVLGTLLDFRAMRKVRTRGIRLANKHVLLAAMAYNLKKLMRHVCYKSAISVAKAANNWLDYVKLVTFNLTRTFLISFYFMNIPQKRVLII